MGPGVPGAKIMEGCDQKPGSERHSVSDALGTGSTWVLVAFVVRLPEGGRYGSHLSRRRSHPGPEIQDSESHMGP